MNGACCSGGGESQSKDACGGTRQGGGPRVVPGPTEVKGPFAWFDRMIANCLEYAKAAKAAGRPIVGILCEYTPRELIMAAGGVPVCLCGGSAETIPAGRGATAGQPLPADQVDLRLPRREAATRFWKWPTWWWPRRPATARRRCTSCWPRRGRCTCWSCRRRPTTSDALTHWVRELGKFRDVPGEPFRGWRSPTRSCARRSRVMNRERRLRRELARSDDGRTARR